MGYRDKFYPKYISTRSPVCNSERTLEEIKKQFPIWHKYFGRFLPENKNAKIIDLGCGNGGLVYWFQEMGFQNVAGVDISQEQIEAAGKLGIKNISQVDIKTFLQNKKEVFDLVFIRDVIEHFTKEEVSAIINLIHQSLKIDGILVVQTVNAGNLLWGRLRHGDFTHEIAFTEESIYQILTFSGFKDIKVCSIPSVIHGLKSLIRSILWKIMVLKLRFYLLVETGSAKGIFTKDLIAKAKK